jgi:hypothetical protein
MSTSERPVFLEVTVQHLKSARNAAGKYRAGGVAADNQHWLWLKSVSASSNFAGCEVRGGSKNAPFPACSLPSYAGLVGVEST